MMGEKSCSAAVTQSGSLAPTFFELTSGLRPAGFDPE